MPEMSYNGVQWISNYKTTVSIRPIADEAKRVTVGNEYTITVDGYIQGGDATLETMRQLLTVRGGALIYSDHGLGTDETLSVNGDSEIRDSTWGPHPEVIEYRPLGGYGQDTAHVIFRVKTTIPECEFTRDYQGLMELNYQVTHEIDESGYTIERLTGHMVRALTRKIVNDRSVPNTVDEYRERLENRKPRFGFQRSGQVFQVSADRRRLDFQWTDTELPAALPPRVTKIDCWQTVRSRGPWMGNLWEMTLSATITMARGVKKSDSLRTFLLLLADRASGVGKGDLGANSKNTSIIRTHVEVSDNVFGRETRYVAKVDFLKRQRLDEILLTSNMWQPAPSAVGATTTHDLWAASLVPFGTHAVRGGAGLKVEGDYLVDLCMRQDSTITAAPPPRKTTPTLSTRPSTSRPETGKGTPPDTWIAYWCYFKWVEKQNNARHKLLPKKPVEPTRQGGQGRGGSLRQFDTPRPSGGSSTNALQEFPGKGGALQAFPESRQQAVAPFATGSDTVLDSLGAPAAYEGPSALFAPDVVQKAASATRTAYLYGMGIRVGYRIPAPRLVSVAGLSVVEQSREIDEVVLWKTDLGPVYCTRWVIEYIVPEAPAGSLPLPGNPWLDVSGAARDSIG